MGRTFRVGEVAAMVGVSVRTLHHYDERGLLVPSQRNAASYRLYGEELDELMEKYYTNEHLEAFERLGQEAGPEEVAAVERAWAKLIPAVRAAREAGIAPSDPRSQELGQRWRELVERTFRGETELLSAVGAAYEAGAFAPDPALPNQDDFAFIAAVEAARGTS